jgi:hypothetical protein
MELKVGDTVYFMTSQTAYLVEHVSSQNERFVTFKPAGVNSYIDLYKNKCGHEWTVISNPAQTVVVYTTNPLGAGGVSGPCREVTSEECYGNCSLGAIAEQKDDRQYFLVHTKNSSFKINAFNTKAELQAELDSMKANKDNEVFGVFHGTQISTKLKYVLEDK